MQHNHSNIHHRGSSERVGGKSDLPTPTYADVARRTTPQHATTTTTTPRRTTPQHTTTTTHAAQTHGVGVARSMEGMRADVVKLEPSLEPIFAVKKFTQKRKGAKAVKAFEKDAIGSDGKLDRENATTFRAISARANYVAQDRADGSYSSKELCRELSAPNENSLMKLKRLGRYYKGRPRMVYRYDFAESPATHFDVYCDTDFAGCAVTRRSTSGGCCMISGCQVKHWSKTQTTIALSSGEAELSGIGSGMAQGLGIQSLCADMLWPLKVRVHSDATAAIGISKRRGLGKIRHLHTADLWVQERTRNGDVELLKVLGTENPADAFTKYLDKGAMEAALKRMNLEFRDGRAVGAPVISAQPPT